MSRDLDVNASAMALQTVRAEYSAACDKANALLGMLVRLRERRQTLHVDPTDASVMITCIRDLDSTTLDLERAEKDRDSLGKLVEDMTKAHDRVERDHKAWTFKQKEPQAKEALAESQAKFKEWCKYHATVENMMREAGMVTYGNGYSSQFGQIIYDHGLLATFGKCIVTFNGPTLAITLGTDCQFHVSYLGTRVAASTLHEALMILERKINHRDDRFCGAV